MTRIREQGQRARPPACRRFDQRKRKSDNDCGDKFALFAAMANMVVGMTLTPLQRKPGIRRVFLLGHG